MKHIFNSRSTSMCLIGMSMLFILGYKYPQAVEYVAMPIALMSGGLAFAKSWEAVKSTTAKDQGGQK